jgi:hypothetical protein
LSAHVLAVENDHRTHALATPTNPQSVLNANWQPWFLAANEIQACEHGKFASNSSPPDTPKSLSEPRRASHDFDFVGRRTLLDSHSAPNAWNESVGDVSADRERQTAGCTLAMCWW